MASHRSMNDVQRKEWDLHYLDFLLVLLGFASEFTAEDEIVRKKSSLMDEALEGGLVGSFGVFPGIATFGQGYVRQPDYAKAPNRWLLDPHVETMVDNVHLMVGEPKLMVASARAAGLRTTATGFCNGFKITPCWRRSGPIPMNKSDE